MEKARSVKISCMGRKEEKEGKKLRGRASGGSTAPTQLCGQLQEREALPMSTHWRTKIALSRHDPWPNFIYFPGATTARRLSSRLASKASQEKRAAPLCNRATQQSVGAR